VKPDNASAKEADRSNVRGLTVIGLPRTVIGSREASDQLYWKCAPDLLFVARPSHTRRFVYDAVNPAFEALFGILSEEIRETAVSDGGIGREDSKSICEILDACLAEGAEVRLCHKLALGGSPRIVETIVTPIRDPRTGAIVRFIGSLRVAGKGSSDATLGHAPDGDTGINVLSIQEDMQQRIASDLHDSTCQHLIAASLGVMRLRGSLSEPAKADQLCEDIDASIDRALKEIRAFAYLLHPQDLAAAGLKATIEQYAEGLAARTSLKVSGRISAEVDGLPFETQRSLLRVVQEGLTNVFRHAKATEVEIAIEAVDNHFMMSLSDNGRGMPAGQAVHGAKKESLGVGIPAMRVRLQQIGGTLEIRSRDTGRPGTKLCAVFPRVHATLETRPAKRRRHHRHPHDRIMKKRAGK